jgi:hypothetical protein
MYWINWLDCPLPNMWDPGNIGRIHLARGDLDKALEFINKTITHIFCDSNRGEASKPQAREGR